VPVVFPELEVVFVHYFQVRLVLLGEVGGEGRVVVSWSVLGWGLQVEVGVDFELGPDELGVLPFLGEGPPAAAFDEAADELGVVALADVYFEFDFFWSVVEEEAVGEGNFPDEIFVVVSLEGWCECFCFWFYWMEFHHVALF
jgi:hypothetical protein